MRDNLQVFGEWSACSCHSPPFQGAPSRRAAAQAPTRHSKQSKFTRNPTKATATKSIFFWQKNSFCWTKEFCGMIELRETCWSKDLFRGGGRVGPRPVQTPLRYIYRTVKTPPRQFELICTGSRYLNKWPEQWTKILPNWPFLLLILSKIVFFSSEFLTHCYEPMTDDRHLQMV